MNSLRTGKSPFIGGKSPIDGPFSIAMLNYQRVIHCAVLLKVVGPFQEARADPTAHAPGLVQLIQPWLAWKDHGLTGTEVGFRWVLGGVDQQGPTKDLGFYRIFFQICYHVSVFVHLCGMMATI